MVTLGVKLRQLDYFPLLSVILVLADSWLVWVKKKSWVHPEWDQTEWKWSLKGAWRPRTNFSTATILHKYYNSSVVHPPAIPPSLPHLSSAICNSPQGSEVPQRLMIFSSLVRDKISIFHSALPQLDTQEGLMAVAEGGLVKIKCVCVCVCVFQHRLRYRG